MITKTDYEMILKLDEKFKPKNKGFISGEEIIQIKNGLQIKERDILSLRNLRNFVVLYYSIEKKDNMEDMDKMSAIVSVIDDIIFNFVHQA